jgi:assimilatory nitrate reductase catalytic subunit
MNQIDAPNRGQVWARTRWNSQWHTQTRTGKSAMLKKLYPDHIYVEMNSLDAEPLGIEANQKVLVASKACAVSVTPL